MLRQFGQGGLTRVTYGRCAQVSAVYLETAVVLMRRDWDAGRRLALCFTWNCPLNADRDFVPLEPPTWQGRATDDRTGQSFSRSPSAQRWEGIGG